MIIPDGFRFGTLNVHAESWEAWDALRHADGWRFESSNGILWKKRGNYIDGHIVAHAPHGKRP